MTKPYVPTPLRNRAPVEPSKKCARCGEVKPNDFDHFGKKLQGTRNHFVTHDVCKFCTRMAISKGMAEMWKNKRGSQDPFS